MIESKHDEMVASSHLTVETSDSSTTQNKSRGGLMDSTTTILGSFFEKNQEEDDEYNRKYNKSNNKIDEEENMMMQTTTKDWLITPLPCLTSITASQRSIESDPLENLLIEHPSMSVFVAATSSQNSDVSFDEEEEGTDVQMTLDEEVKQVVAVIAAKKPEVVVSNKVANVLTKSLSEKRKVHTSPSPNSSVSSESLSPVQSIQKRKGMNKKNKKQNKETAGAAAAAQTENKENGSANNKENNASAMFLAETFKKQSNAARLEALLLNKNNQMKRSNKNSVFAAAGAKAANAKHRKYHKLQQPACFQSSKPVF
jgi:hypothetical protein